MHHCDSYGIWQLALHVAAHPSPYGSTRDCLCKMCGLCFQVMDMPLLFETGAYMLTWPRVLVAADPATQV